MRKRKVFASTKSLTLMAMLVAMSVVIGIFCKSVLDFGGVFRVTFENLPIILAGMVFGPITGGIVGLSSDIISYLLSGQAYPLNPVVTLGAVSVGIISGLIAKYVVKRRGYMQIAICEVTSHLIGSMIIKPIGLYAFYQWAVLWRIPIYLGIIPAEIVLLSLLYKNSGFRRLITDIDKEKL